MCVYLEDTAQREIKENKMPAFVNHPGVCTQVDHMVVMLTTWFILIRQF